ncbi:MAG: kelch repeat-containing protein [Planctomycetota bacterium]
MKIINRLQLSILLCIVFGFMATVGNVAKAHFIWVYARDGKIQVVFGEGLEPDQAEFLAGLSTMKAYKIVDGRRVGIELAKQVDGGQCWFEISTEDAGHALDIHCPYGIFGRGDKTMLLNYSAKYVNLANAKPAKVAQELDLDLIPHLNNGEVKITAFFQGKPVKGVEIEVTRNAGESDYATTGRDGVATVKPISRFLIRGKYTVEESGEFNGEKYSEKRYYCTLVLDTAADKIGATNTAEQDKSVASIKLEKLETKLGKFPKGMTSFGGTVLGNRIFVIGGKSGKAHSYAKAYQNRNVYSLVIDGSNNEWQIVGENHGLQGLAIVGHGQHVYRIGGLEARNKEGDDHDLHSVSDFVAFDPEKKSWKTLPSLPAGRSSFDACLIGDDIYVVGGWTMGDDESEWATTILKFDLTKPESDWQSIKAPFETRALAVNAHDEKLIIVGGITNGGGPTNEVHIFDPKTNSWVQGAPVPTEGGMKAFGCSAVSLEGSLLVSTYDGGIYQMSKNASAWTKIHQLDTGRFFHQMLPVAKNRFALVGGSHMETGSHFEVEIFECRKASAKGDSHE